MLSQSSQAPQRMRLPRLAFSTSSFLLSKYPDFPPWSATSALYHVVSIWLFTSSDFKTIIAPSTAFSILHKLASPSFGVEHDSETTTLRLVTQAATVAGWAWINLLPFVIDNQRQVNGIEEDRHNKPWRPLPSARMTPKQATNLMLATYPVAILASICLGAPLQSVTLLGFGIWYNDLRGADANWLIRNFINACGFVCYTSGALQVALQIPVFFNETLSKWFIIIGAIVFSTIQIQDMSDQVGDKKRSRRTAPLVLGDHFARWTIALPMLFWCWFCPWFWSVPAGGYTLPVALGGTVATRTFLKRTVEDDKSTFRLWNLWMVSLYTLPLIQLKLVEV